MSKPIIQLNEESVKSELKELVRNKAAYTVDGVKGRSDRNRSLRCMQLKGTLDSAAGIRYRANKRGLAAPSPDFPALDFILAEMFLRKILDSTRKLPTSAGGIPPIYLSFFSALTKNKAYLLLEMGFVSNLNSFYNLSFFIISIHHHRMYKMTPFISNGRRNRYFINPDMQKIILLNFSLNNVNNAI